MAVAVAVSGGGLVLIFVSSVALLILHFSLLTLLPALVVSAAAAASPGLSDDPGKFIFGPGFHGGENLAPWAYDLLKFSPPAAALGPAALESGVKYPLVLGEKRTTRPDILNSLRLYRGGWNITNKHYWASVGFTGAAGFILAAIWFVSFPLALGVVHCCRRRIGIWEKDSSWSKRICLILLLVFTCAALIGCTLLSVGQDKFRGEVLDTLSFVVNQSNYTVEILRNVTDYLLLAEATSIGQFNLPSNVQEKIDSLNVELENAAGILSEATINNSRKIKQALDYIRSALIAVAVVMLCFAVLGFLLSIFRHRHAIYIFITSSWLLVTATFILCGVFVIVSYTVGDTCAAMDEWVRNSQAKIALSNILPCVDERTTNLTLHQSKEVIAQVVDVVNTAISTIANSDHSSQDTALFYNQSGPTMPFLCSPYDSQLRDRQCGPQEVLLVNASVAWQKYVCDVSNSGICITVGRITPDIYRQLVTALNVSYALDHYTPFVLNLKNCNFVRKTFNSITANYCVNLELDLRMLNAGFALVASGVMLCLMLWLFYVNRPQREEVFAKPCEVKMTVVSQTPTRTEV